MKKTAWIGVVLLLLFLARPLAGQPVISSSQLPSNGDTFFLAVDKLPAGIRVLAPGPNQRWDFTSLMAPFSRQYVWRSESKGKTGTQSLITQTESLSEARFLRSSSEIKLYEAFGLDPFGLSRKSRMVYSPALPTLKLPLRYQDHSVHRSNLTVTIAAGDLSNLFLRKLPFQPDSIRLKVAIERRTDADAWGKLIIPGGIYDVVRQKQTETRTIVLEARIGQRKWQNITAISPMSDLFPNPNSLVYTFFSNNALEPIAIVTVDPRDQSVEKVEFRVTDAQELPILASMKADLFAFPNPAIVNVRFEFFNLPAGDYELSIYNLLGVPLIKKRYFISGNRTEKLDISELRKGTYLYSLKDDRGNTLTTKRLIVIRP
ncbi:MAG: hypothetical protein KIPDCIKN_03940 [Haliscomenobacter sp.]|nr:hypothetical protein [Haliscomenobacter sp.]